MVGYNNNSKLHIKPWGDCRFFFPFPSAPNDFALVFMLMNVIFVAKKKKKKNNLIGLNFMCCHMHERKKMKACWFAAVSAGSFVKGF